MRTVLIDVKTRTVTDVEYSGDFHEIYKLIGCSMFQVVDSLPDGDEMFVDEEGLLTMTPDSVFFRIPWFRSPIAGSALIMSCDPAGEATASKHDAAFYRQHVQFMGAAAAWFASRVANDVSQF